jgi:hypothetical protein
MDPVGFALENFSPIGAWRERDGDSAIDASGTLVDGTQVVGLADLAKALDSRSELYVTNVTEKLMTYGLGRAVDYRDMPTVRAIVRRAQGDHLKVSSLILGVVQSEAFRQRVKSGAKGAGLTARE